MSASSDPAAPEPTDNLLDTSAAAAATDPLPADGGTAVKDPDDWTTGDEPMTDSQRSYLQTLAQQHGKELPADPLTKAEASKLIDSLRSGS